MCAIHMPYKCADWNIQNWNCACKPFEIYHYATLHIKSD